MEKIYIKPATNLQPIEADNLLQASDTEFSVGLEKNLDKTVEPNEAYAKKGYNVWSDDEE